MCVCVCVCGDDLATETPFITGDWLHSNATDRGSGLTTAAVRTACQTLSQVCKSVITIVVHHAFIIVFYVCAKYLVYYNLFGLQTFGKVEFGKSRSCDLRNMLAT